MSNEKSVMAVIRAARPSFKNNHDKVAFAVHAAFLSSGLVLTAAGPPALADDALSSTSTDEVGIDNWNDFDDHYAFVYANPEKGSKKVLVKGMVMNGKLLVDALADGSSEPAHLEIDIDNYIGESGSGNYSAQYKNLDKLVSNLDKEVISKLYGSTSKSSSSSKPPSQETGEGSGRDRNDPLVGRNDPLGPQIHPSGVVVPPIMPIPDSDLYPGSGPGMYPRSGFHGPGSMLIGPNDPRWNIRFGEPGFPGGEPGVPPGANFDPYGPPGVPGFEPNRFIRHPRRPGAGTHPDLEHFNRDGSDFI
ncbi:Proteasome Inhibitor PI31 [Corchorus olitorius]|uniref:Proteasome Inhibitor PI31 n=1 Tax=Corchorus olitorius TaxID=93759 RepID=A0A1R3JQX4_9ROSI|nr:Proteasome Inhibitor PI31 [Corchorus olitorius]